MMLMNEYIQGSRTMIDQCTNHDQYQHVSAISDNRSSSSFTIRTFNKNGYITPKSNNHLGPVLQQPPMHHHLNLPVTDAASACLRTLRWGWGFSCHHVGSVVDWQSLIASQWWIMIGNGWEWLIIVNLSESRLILFFGSAFTCFCRWFQPLGKIFVN